MNHSEGCNLREWRRNGEASASHFACPLPKRLMLGGIQSRLGTGKIRVTKRCAHDDASFTSGDFGEIAIELASATAFLGEARTTSSESCSHCLLLDNSHRSLNDLHK